MEERAANSPNSKIFWGTLILLLLRFPLLYAASMFDSFYIIGFVLYMCGTYVVTGIVLYQNRHFLYCCNITWVAIALFLGTPLLAAVSGQYYSDPTVWVRLAASCVFGVLFYRKRHSFQVQKMEKKSILPNVLITLVLCIAVPFAIHAVRGFPSVAGGGGYSIPDSLIFQLSTAAMSEEPLFRGFLWGFLISKKLPPGLVCIIQAALFWIGHIYYIGTGINFWLIHPLVALTLGLLVWKTKSITHTMVLHTCINAITDYLRVVPFF